MAKTEQLPYDFYTDLSQTYNINQENPLDKHAHTDTETRILTWIHMHMHKQCTHIHTNAHTHTSTHTHIHTNTITYAHIQCVYTFLGNNTHATKKNEIAQYTIN